MSTVQKKALKTLHSIFTRVWEDEVVPEEWHQGIIIPLFKWKGSRSDCSNYGAREGVCEKSFSQELGQPYWHTDVPNRAVSLLVVPHKIV